jgi:hypothetical protein
MVTETWICSSAYRTWLPRPEYAVAHIGHGYRDLNMQYRISDMVTETWICGVESWGFAITVLIRYLIRMRNSQWICIIPSLTNSRLFSPVDSWSYASSMLRTSPISRPINPAMSCAPTAPCRCFLAYQWWVLTVFLLEDMAFFYKGPLQSSWIQLITPSRNFVEVQWRSLLRSTSLSKRCTSYNAPPTSRKHRAADRWSLRNFLPRNSLFIVRKAQESNGARSGLYGGCSNGVPPIRFFKANTEFNSDLAPSTFWAFPTMKMEFWGMKFKVINGLQHVFEKWVGRCKKCIACQGRYFEMRPSPHLHKVPTRSNTVSPWSLQAALVLFQDHTKKTQ